jgi:glutamate-5-semialdehyde dehydrogenase
MKILTTETKNNVLASMMLIMANNKAQLIAENQKDLKAFDKSDQALYDRLIVHSEKVESMIQSVKEVMEQDDPIDRIISTRTLSNGLLIENRTTPFGTIMIIYESRPDVTIEAAVVAFKSNNKILLKGGREAYFTNKELVRYWHLALAENGLERDWITMLELNRQQTQDYLKNEADHIDLIVPRGGQSLIEFVKEYAKCPVLVSGRGNNFIYVATSADWDKTKKVILNAKTDKISACNALDKVLIDNRIHGFYDKVKDLVDLMKDNKVTVLGDHLIAPMSNDVELIHSDDVWKEEFLSRKILIGTVSQLDDAIDLINKHSGHHSSIIMTEDVSEARTFMQHVDSAAVYHNASSRFTDGGAMGVGAELAISTDKLHHRGPLGLEQLVTNKYYVTGDGHIRN